MVKKTSYNISVLPGDGIGPELTEEVVKVLNTAQQIFSGFSLNYSFLEAGAGLYLRTGEIFPREEYDAVVKSDAIYKGPVGLPEAVLPDGTINDLPRQEIAKEFLRLHKDEYDFLVIFSNFDFELPEAEAKAFYLEVKNDTQGIGKELFDDTAQFGSDGKLQGIIDMGNNSELAAIALDPEFKDAYANRGVAYKEMGMKSEAIADLSKFVSLATAPEEIALGTQLLQELR